MCIHIADSLCCTIETNTVHSPLSNSKDMNLSKIREMVKDREAWRAAVRRTAKSPRWLRDWKTTRNQHNSVKKEQRLLLSHFSCVRLFSTPWTAARQASLSISNSRTSLKLMSIESVMPSSHLILCRPLLLLSPIPPSIRVFSNESALRMRWPKYWGFSFCISPSKEHPGLISFRMDWLDLLAVQGTKSLLQHHSSKASILRRSAFFTVQLSHPYVTTGKKHSID